MTMTSLAVYGRKRGVVQQSMTYGVEVDDPARDAGLARAAANGDRTALAALHQQHAPTLWRIAYLICRTRADADDASSAAWEAIVRHISQFRGDNDRTWLAWAAAIVRREARHKSPWQRHVTLSADMLDHDSLTMGESDAADTRHVVAAALATLKPAAREALALTYWAGMTDVDAASYCKVTPGAFRVRLSRARQDLLAALPADFRDNGSAPRQRCVTVSEHQTRAAHRGA